MESCEGGIADAIEYSVRGASMVTPQHLDACARLFSEQYGVWGAGAPPARRGCRVRLSADKLRQQCLFHDNCCLAMATLADGQVVGHAFATRFLVNDVGWFSWITQLVVHSGYRNHGVASKLCQMAWDVEAVAGCGIVTSHPHAIRALEKATRRRCRPGMIERARSLIAASHIPYLQGCCVSCQQSDTMCTVDSGFFVDHMDINQLIPSQPPRLGLKPLEDGHEFVAFTLKAWTPHHSREVSPSNSGSSDDDEHDEGLKFLSMIVITMMLMQRSAALGGEGGAARVE